VGEEEEEEEGEDDGTGESPKHPPRLCPRELTECVVEGLGIEGLSTEEKGRELVMQVNNNTDRESTKQTEGGYPELNSDGAWREEKKAKGGRAVGRDERRFRCSRILLRRN
jgi:hypothetical protein